jgi:dihydrofolate synthase/folylpolyglutamate synthase
MLHSYEEARDWIHNQLPVGIKPGLVRMEWMMEQLNHPERRIKSIHVGGTNGKGSTVSYISNILQEADYVVGTFTSPYIEHFNERISINGEPISEEDFLAVSNIIKPLTEQLKDTELGCPTEFEVITAISMVYFAKLNIPDVVIFEVGLGGRLDSTNIIQPLLSVITNIGFDHMRFLGETISEIAYEKAGIIKPGMPILTASDNQEVLQIFNETAESTNSKLYQLNRQFQFEDYFPTEQGGQFTFSSVFDRFEHLKIQMKGKHQIENASLALMAIIYLKKYYSFIIEEENIRKGLLNTKWIGRFEQVNDQPLVIIDGAHNLEGIKSLSQTLNSYYADKIIHVIFSALKDKPVKQMLNVLYENENIEHITFTSFNFPRVFKARELFDQSSFTKKEYIEDFEDAIQSKLRNIEHPNEMLVITGSLYFISEVRNNFTQKKG